ncbi:hypothetical protein FB567DRAFT_520517 [Paraphoma chrysanthemicola]|uniref:Secreted protein n=1 Tax=Paraphoma chrysanthemicola TaxID=798071 RepID=A0A8K0RE56_9PLEO|nr:hypothetical protein FB567DRAFT_520517 [Paraphoma chrysanthemicola]
MPSLALTLLIFLIPSITPQQPLHAMPDPLPSLASRRRLFSRHLLGSENGAEGRWVGGAAEGTCYLRMFSHSKTFTPFRECGAWITKRVGWGTIWSLVLFRCVVDSRVFTAVHIFAMRAQPFVEIFG